MYISRWSISFRQTILGNANDTDIDYIIIFQFYGRQQASKLFQFFISYLFASKKSLWHFIHFKLHTHFVWKKLIVSIILLYSPNGTNYGFFCVQLKKLLLFKLYCLYIVHWTLYIVKTKIVNFPLQLIMKKTTSWLFFLHNMTIILLTQQFWTQHV